MDILYIGCSCSSEITLLWNEETHSLCSVLEFGLSLYSAGLPENRQQMNSYVHTMSEFKWHIFNAHIIYTKHYCSSSPCCTLAEENRDQDSDDWDDVGLNIAKPPGLLYLFCNYSTFTLREAGEYKELGI